MERWDEDIDSDDYTSDEDEGLRVYPWYYLDMPTHEAVRLSGVNAFYNTREERAWRMSAFISSIRILYSQYMAHQLMYQVRLYLARHPQADHDLIGYETFLRRYMDYMLHHENVKRYQ